jgi:hypothetical protein
MGISRFGSRLSILLLAFLIAGANAASAAAQTALYRGLWWVFADDSAAARD